MGQGFWEAGGTYPAKIDPGTPPGRLVLYIEYILLSEHYGHVFLSTKLSPFDEN